MSSNYHFQVNTAGAAWNDAMNAIDDLLLAAHHEAGHTVAGFRFGAVVGPLSVSGVKIQDSITSWGDDADADINTVGLESGKIAQVALAGPWAGIKFQGYSQAHIRPDTHATVEPESMAAVIDAMTRELDNPRDPPKDIRATLVIGRQRHEFFGRLGDSARDIATARSCSSDLSTAATEALMMINDQEVWAMIVRLASALVDATMRIAPVSIDRAFVTKSLSTDDITRLLSIMK